MWKKAIDILNKVPVTYLPALLQLLIKRCINEKIFNDGMISDFVAKIEAAAQKTEERTAKATNKQSVGEAPQICPHYDSWTFLDNKQNIIYKVPACTCAGKLHA